MQLQYDCEQAIAENAMQHHLPPITHPISRRARGAALALAAGACLVACVDPVRDDATARAASELAAVQDDVEALLAAVAAFDDAITRARGAAVGAAYDRIAATIDAVALAAGELRDAGPGDPAGSLDQLSRRAGQLAPQLRRLARDLAAAELDADLRRELRAGLARVKLAARGVDLHVTEILRARATAAPVYVLDAGHVDAIDAELEDGELAISIHDETTDPGVERDPARTLLVAKREARWTVPDDRFAFLGPVGRTVWLLPENELDAEAAGVLWPGLSTEELEAGVFVDDTIEARFLQVAGPDGLALFESPQDEATAPVVRVDSEDGLPDTIALSTGTHEHINWAFEAPGLYQIQVDVRGRLAGVSSAPWVTSARTVLRFAVLP
jgi:surface-anchored protein